jgi:hypothetical protein
MVTTLVSLLLLPKLIDFREIQGKCLFAHIMTHFLDDDTRAVILLSEELFAAGMPLVERDF